MLNWVVLLWLNGCGSGRLCVISVWLVKLYSGLLVGRVVVWLCRVVLLSVLSRLVMVVWFLLCVLLVRLVWVWVCLVVVLKVLLVFCSVLVWVMC